LHNNEVSNISGLSDVNVELKDDEESLDSLPVSLEPTNKDTVINNDQLNVYENISQHSSFAACLDESCTESHRSHII